MPENKNIVLAGGGHAHLLLIKHARRLISSGCKVSLITPSPYHYYSGMGPGMLKGTYRPEDVRFPVKEMVERAGGKVIMGMLKEIKPDNHEVVLENGMVIPYDILSLNIGSSVASDIVIEETEGVFTVKPIENLYEVRKRIVSWPETKPLKVVVVGGGPAGVEVAANVEALLRTTKKDGYVVLVAGKRLLHRFPERVRRIVIENFSRRAIEVIEGQRAERLHDRVLVLSDGRSLYFDICILATGIRVSEVFRNSGLPVAEDGSLRVNTFLQALDYPEIFGAGDCITIENHRMDRVGVYAVKEAPVLLYNILAFCERKKLKEFKPPEKYLLILNLGDGRGVFFRGSVIFDGRLPWYLKDLIDRRFVRRFR